MYFRYGDYETPVNSSWATMNFRARIGQTGRKISEIQRWSIHTVLTADTQAALEPLISAHEAGMKRNNVDLTFYKDDGTETVHKIVNSQTANGIEFKGISYPGYWPQHTPQKTEYVNLRYVVSQHEAEVFDVEENIIFLWQSLQYSLGGSDYAVLGAFLGLPVTQFTMQSTPFWAVQRGTAIGMFSNPIPLGPIVNGLPNPRKSWVREESPQHYGRVRHWGYPTTWNYFFESPGSLRGTPPTIL